MDEFIQTLISSLVVLLTIVIVYFSFRSFLKTTTGKGGGCHSSGNSDCTQCGVAANNNNSFKIKG